MAFKPLPSYEQLATFRKKKISVPKNQMVVEEQIYETPIFTPASTGEDGFLYGKKDGKIARCIYDEGSESYEVETGADVSGIQWATKTNQGYVVLAGKKIHFSNDFDSGFSEVYEMTRETHEMTRFVLHDYNLDAFKNNGYNSLVIFAEYDQETGGPDAHVYASFDGGETFETVLTHTATDPDNNNHFHVATYDEYKGRFWALAGDGENKKMYYTDDITDDWNVADIENSVYNDYDSLPTQPTLLIPMREKLFLSGDSSSIVGGIGHIEKDMELYTPNTEKFVFKWDLPLRSEINSADAYLRAPYAKKDNEAFVFSADNGISHIVGTGDGGNTWHLVFTTNTQKSAGDSPGIYIGVFGPDKRGRIFAGYRNRDSSRILVFKKPEWEVL